MSIGSGVVARGRLGWVVVGVLLAALSWVGSARAAWHEPALVVPHVGPPILPFTNVVSGLTAAGDQVVVFTDGNRGILTRTRPAGLSSFGPVQTAGSFPDPGFVIQGIPSQLLRESDGSMTVLVSSDAGLGVLTRSPPGVWGALEVYERSGVKNQLSARLAVSGTRAALLWQDCAIVVDGGVTDVSDCDLRVAVRGVDGVWGASTVVDQNACEIFDGDVGVSSNGEVVAVWARNESCGGGRRDLYARERSAGGTWSAITQITTAGGGFNGAYNQPRVVLDDDGDAVAVAEDFLGVGGIYASRPSAGAWSATEEAPQLDEILLGVDASDRVTLVYAGTAGVVSRLRAASGTWGSAETIGAQLGDESALRPVALVVAPTGEAAALWHSSALNGTIDGLARVRVAQRDLAGTWAAAEVVADVAGSLSGSGFDFRPGVDTVASWRRYAQSAFYTSFDEATWRSETAPADEDGDGVPDSGDACPAESGPASNAGCPLGPDADGDGVPDSGDACPAQAGPASNGGCPLPDSDGDGVLDINDACPLAAGPAATNGCPIGGSPPPPPVTPPPSVEPPAPAPPVLLDDVAIAASYLEAFGRLPTPGERAFWKTQATTYQDMLARHRDVLQRQPADGTAAVTRAIALVYGRKSLPASQAEITFRGRTFRGELAYWRFRLANDDGVQDWAGLVRAQRADLARNRGERQLMIERTYLYVFGRDPSAGELKHWRTRRDWTDYTDLVRRHRAFLRANPAQMRAVVRQASVLATGFAPDDPRLLARLKARERLAFGLYSRAQAPFEIVHGYLVALIRTRPSLRESVVRRSYEQVFTRQPDARELRVWLADRSPETADFNGLVAAHHRYLQAHPAQAPDAFPRLGASTITLTDVRTVDRAGDATTASMPAIVSGAQPIITLGGAAVASGQLVLSGTVRGNLISQNGAGIIGQDSGSIIGQDSGSIIGQDSGSLIGHAGGNIISSGGLN